MKWIYKALSRPELGGGGVLLGWHEKVSVELVVGCVKGPLIFILLVDGSSWCRLHCAHYDRSESGFILSSKTLI